MANSKYHRVVVPEKKSLEFENLPLMAVEVRFHADGPRFEMNLRAAGRIEDAFLSHGLTADAVFGQREFPGSKRELNVPPLGLQQVVGKDSRTGAAIAIQDTMLKVEWRRQVGEQARPYPRYPALEEIVMWGLNQMNELASPDTFSPTIANMTYVNFVPAGDAAGPASALRILQGHYRDAVPRDASDVHELNVRWKQSSGLDRGLLFSQAERQLGDERDAGFLLQTITGKRIGDEAPIDALKQCHWDLQAFFVECTSEEARKSWGQKNG